jgi:tight adherence protein C
MTQALIVGAVLGLGLWLTIVAIVPARVPLTVASRRLQREGRIADLDTDQHDGLALRIGRALLPAVGEHRVLRSNTQRDLAIVGRAIEDHVGRKCVAALIGLVYVPAATVGLQLAGVQIPVVLPVWASIATAALGWFLPDLLLASEAEERRRSFRHALGAFVDVMVMLLAANEGIEGSLHLAAASGDGWAFAEIRKALRDAQVQGDTPWRALSQLGQDLGVNDLIELAATASLAGAEGASVRRSLVTKAASIRAHTAAEEEAEAQSASARMTLPMLVLLIGFILFIGYPAVTLVVTGS